MKRTVVTAAVIAATAAVTVSACSSGASSTDNAAKGGAAKSVMSTDGKGKTITVWLMTDAQKGWPAVVDAANAQFEKETGAKVSVQWQNWPNYTTKLDSTFAGSTGIPDVVELGNTQTASYISAGAFTDLTADRAKFDNSATWLQGLTESATSPDGKLMAVPYYAGSRVVIYRTDMFTKAGITAPPTTLDELNADAAKLKAAYPNDPNFSAFYMPGQYWYAAMSLVYGAGGKIAEQSGGKWQGALESPQAQQGLEQWKKLATEFSRGGATKNEADQDAIMAQGHTAMILGNGWEVGSVIDPKTGNPNLKDVVSTFPMPGSAAGQYTPSFLGGSDLAVPEKASNGGLGATWVQIYTNTAQQKALAKFAIPNNTALLADYQAAGQANRSTGEAAKNTWFVPNTPAWANVESGNVLQNMLGAIATGKKSVADATAAADAQITHILNAGG